MKSTRLSLALALAVAAFAANAATGPELLKSKGCLGCHDAEKKKVGPAYKDVAAKYKDDKAAEAKIVEGLKAGKPKHPVAVKATDDELKAMVKEVLSAK